MHIRHRHWLSLSLVFDSFDRIKRRVLRHSVLIIKDYGFWSLSQHVLLAVPVSRRTNFRMPRKRRRSWLHRIQEISRHTIRYMYMYTLATKDQRIGVSTANHLGAAPPVGITRRVQAVGIKSTESIAALEQYHVEITIFRIKQAAVFYP